MRHTHSCTSQSSTRLFWAATMLAACFLKLSAATTDDDSAVTRTLDGDTEDNNLQVPEGLVKYSYFEHLLEFESSKEFKMAFKLTKSHIHPKHEEKMSTRLAYQLGGLGVIKKDWDKNLQMWGKRGWGQLSGDWGKKKRSISPAWDDEDSLTIPVVQKRSWQRLHGGWGKRTLSYSDDNEVQDIASILDQQDNHNIHVEPETDYDFHVDEKRKWKQFSDGWGKRANNKWNNFRGSWGKRDPSWVNLKGMWGKRSSADYLSSE